MEFDNNAGKQIAFSDLERELSITRTVLEHQPEERFDWKVHEKSMSLGRLAFHTAELPNWMAVTLAQDELDAANAPRPPAGANDRTQLLTRFDANVAELHKAVERFDMANWDKPWTMRKGQQVLVTRARSFVFRVWGLNHMIHHRAQLCVYLRLLNVAVPTVYFNTADDPTWRFE